MRRGLGLMIAAVLVGALPHDADAAGPKIKVLSSRADLVSGGDALIAVKLPKGAKGLRVRAGSRNVTPRFKRIGRQALGYVRGLKRRTVITATVRGGRGAKLRVTSHPRGGPMFTGPQIQPWKCQEAAVDAQCNQPPTFRFLYKPALTAQLQPYDPADPPGDVATTTTDQGVEVPFVVRQETGYLNRDQYKILTLFDPSQPWTALAPQEQFNHKLFIPHGGGCGSAHEAGIAPLADFSGTIPENPAIANSYVEALGKGFTVMSTALANLGHNCNVATAAEALMMTKERVIERYGTVRYTIGSGCSGGSITQQMVANAYPRAVYDGLILTCAYPDAMTALVQFGDYHLLRRFFEGAAGLGAGLTPLQWGPIQGRPEFVNGIAADEVFFKTIPDPSQGCVPADQVYQAATRPAGVRCGLLDYLVNQLGPRPKAAWSAMEQQAGRGFAGVPFGNVGVQYGLSVLKQGLITPQQFVELNANAGGFDVDLKAIAQRSPGDDKAVARAYRTGLINEANNLADMAIIHHAGPDPGAAHDYAHSFWIRDRLERSQGHHDNHVLWFGLAPLFGDVGWPVEALEEMDRWLAAVEADTSKRSRAQKVVADKPADLVDRCLEICETELATRFGTPRSVAGGDQFNDTVKCQLRPLNRADYPALLTDAQFAQLQQIFPTGVCDTAKPGVGQGPTVPWLTYQKASGKVIYGGKPMPAAPRSRTFRKR